MAAKTGAALDRSPVHLLHRAGRSAEQLFQAELGDVDLTARQLVVLSVVAENEGVSQTGIVERTGIDRSTLAELVRRLSKKGLLQRRRRKDDERAYEVKVTAEGAAILRKVGPATRRVDQRILQALNGKDDLFERLRTLIATLQPETG